MAAVQPLALWQGRDSEAWREIWQCGVVQLYAQVGSTNDAVAELAAAGAPDLSVAIAEEQTRGRGRGGANWQARSGSGLLFSVLFRSSRQGAAPGCAPIRIGLAVAEAIEAVAGAATRLKWPNDVVFEGHGKVAGILCEGVFSNAGTQIVAGIGINVSQQQDEFPPDLRARACSILSVTGVSAARGVLLTRIMQRFHAFHDHLTEPLNAQELEQIRKRDVLAHQEVVCESATDTMTGVARGVRADGALLVEQGGEVRPVYNATVRLARTHAFPGGAQ